jgi:hypothetical protein
MKRAIVEAERLMLHVRLGNTAEEHRSPLDIPE